MVWFQCEDCGDNLKKPKLANHFRTCSAHKLSCIDRGQIFGQDTVQDHTQFLPSKKKRKLDALEDEPTSKKNKDEALGEMGNGEVIQVEVAESDVKKNIKWKKFIKSALKSNPDGILKMKKLRKLVFKALQESNIIMDETKLNEAL